MLIYLDTNLWANLVSEIFDQLFAKLDQRIDTTTAQVENLKKELANQSALAAEARVALETAENARKQAEKKLRRETKKRLKEENKVRALLDDLTALLVTDKEVKDQLSEVATGLGLPKLKSSFAELETRAEEVRSLSGRTKALVLAVFTGPGWWQRGLLLAGLYLPAPDDADDDVPSRLSPFLLRDSLSPVLLRDALLRLRPLPAGR